MRAALAILITPPTMYTKTPEMKHRKATATDCDYEEKKPTTTNRSHKMKKEPNSTEMQTDHLPLEINFARSVSDILPEPKTFSSLTCCNSIGTSASNELDKALWKAKKNIETICFISNKWSGSANEETAQKRIWSSENSMNVTWVLSKCLKAITCLRSKMHRN